MQVEVGATAMLILPAPAISFQVVSRWRVGMQVVECLYCLADVFACHRISFSLFHASMRIAVQSPCMRSPPRRAALDAQLQD
ncbi:MAG: hypothetical protein B6D39_00170 [Anaerolineae bacterium UTCFX2]|nr:hypothetical protein [Anaerolineales bacterium]OQY95346.1 MAG: hypothetical protein B6D39_00170 [Anaerolineae bacterium UTCFX2]